MLVSAVMKILLIKMIWFEYNTGECKGVVTLQLII